MLIYLKDIIPERVWMKRYTHDLETDLNDVDKTPSLIHKTLLTASTVTNGAIVIHTQRLKSDPGGNLLS